MIHYGFTKTAQLSIARGLAKRLAGTGVTVNSVLPGPTLSEGVAQMLQADVERSGESLEKVAADFVNEHRSTSIIQRAARVEEVANMIIYASSEQASAPLGRRCASMAVWWIASFRTYATLKKNAASS
jgi:NAD(P)-dependent dehydrogenase (short-subunit alcohol dehydrogenase family)